MTALRPGPLPTTRDYLSLSAAQRSAWVVLLGSMTALGALNIDLYLPAFPALQGELGTSATAVQLTLTGSLAGFAIGQLVIGPLSDALGRRPPALVGLTVFALASVGCALAPSVEVLVALRVLQGIGVAGASVVALAVVNDLFDGAGAARLVSRLILVLGVAPVFAPSIGSSVLAVTSWRGVFVLLAVIALALLLVALGRLPETLPVERRRTAGVRATARTYRVLLGDRAMLGLVVVAGLTISTLFSYVAAAPFVLQDLYGLDAREFALAFAAVGTCLVVGTQLTGQLVTRTDPQQLLLVGLAGALTGSLVLTALVLAGVGGLAGLLLVLCATTLFVGVALPSAPALVLARHGWAAGSAAALLGFAQFGLAGVWAPLVGLVGLRGDVSMALGMALATGLALVLAVTVVRPALAVAPDLGTGTGTGTGAGTDGAPPVEAVAARP